MTLQITVERIQWGQPRAYADSFYEAKITFASDKLYEIPAHEPAIKAVVKAIIRQFDGPDEKTGKYPGWWSRRLDRLELLDKSKVVDGSHIHMWHVCVREPYTD